MTRTFAALALVAALAGAARADSPLELHYSPEERLDRIDADLIATARTAIDLAGYKAHELAEAAFQRLVDEEPS